MTDSGFLTASGEARPLWAGDTPKEPTIFLKPTTSYLEEGAPIVLPSPSVGEIQHELELGLVIGKRCTNISENDALDAVAGYTLALDLTAREVQLTAKEAGMPWTVSKGYDCFCPVSRYIPKNAVADPQQLAIWMSVNGTDRHRGNTKDMIHSIPRLVAWISSVMTLEPGDLILTGTPEGVGPLVPGDTIKAGITGVVEMQFDCR
jgi:acylpyruvate hydrolase